MVLICFPLAKIFGQQVPLSSQYMFNKYLINPALAGADDYYQINTSSRFQYVGIQDFPITNIISVYGPLAEKYMGWGVHVYSDFIGPFSKTGIYASYAFSVKISGETRLSTGLSGGAFMYRVDGNKTEFETPGDPLDHQTVDVQYAPDANVGIYLYNPDVFYFGFSAHQLINNKITYYDDFIGDTSNYWGRLKSHLYVMGGYKFKINSLFAVEPSVLVKSIEVSSFQVDVTARGIYRNTYWLGFGFRSMNALSFLVGIQYRKRIFIGYSYDLGIGNSQELNLGGTHELSIGIMFNEITRF